MHIGMPVACEQKIRGYCGETYAAISFFFIQDWEPSARIAFQSGLCQSNLHAHVAPSDTTQYIPWIIHMSLFCFFVNANRDNSCWIMKSSESLPAYVNVAVLKMSWYQTKPKYGRAWALCIVIMTYCTGISQRKNNQFQINDIAMSVDLEALIWYITYTVLTSQSPTGASFLTKKDWHD